MRNYNQVAAQLSAMRDENRRMADQLSTERKRVDNLVHVVGRLWDVMKTTFPGTVGQFPQELVEADSPNIYITSPTATTSRYPPPLTMNINNPTLHTMHSMSPNSSPTAADFPTHLPHHQPQHHSHHQHQLHPHTLSRQHSFQHLNGYGARGDSSSSTPLPSSPGSGSMDLMDDFEHGRASNKRPRLSSHSESSSLNGGDSGSLLSTVSSPGSSTSPPSVLSNGAGLKAGGGRSSRARSDSAPLGVGGYSLANGGGGLGAIGWHAVNGMRPRSGSGLVSMGPRIPNIGAMSRGGVATPLLSIATHDVLSR
ncbi:hypothetical protein FA15DRAFT_153107 [Coprinopsis marcescibilis]|uniref:Uncharacterized protein n=1 Tax=Coprinopsis marcescibilis TaxID=230819 RepID=A0A5C3KVK8_COPMA|nr:hypothetical protein FA15DRAFT_153107 [Coprinopsis marcescibilis]